MSETILSVGIDVGTTTTQLLFSRLKIENIASGFCVPEMRITEKEILYESEIHFTPLLNDDTIDADGVRDIAAREYALAHVRREEVRSGAVIITGETARKENAQRVVQALAGFAGDFVVATAGPALEGVLAARGAGADLLSEEQPLPVIHADIGGGTSNLTLWEDGKLCATGCYNVGGRLMTLSPDGTVQSISPVLRAHTFLVPGQRVTRRELEPVTALLVQVLEEALGLRAQTDLSCGFVTDHPLKLPGKEALLSFSGGVADLIYTDDPPDELQYGDLGVLLGQAIRRSPLMQRANRKGRATIRATVLGAGAHSVELSGSTVFADGVSLPLQNLPVLLLDGTPEPEALRERLDAFTEEIVAVSVPGTENPSYEAVLALAAYLAPALRNRRSAVVICRADMAMALGYVLRPLLGGTPLLCLDQLQIPEGSYLDIGERIESTYPVVIKTLIFSH